MVKSRSSISEFYKIAGITGGILFILFGITFVYSHGTTPQNRMLPIFGVNQVAALTIIAILFYICLGITLTSLKNCVTRTGKFGRFSYMMVQVGYIALLISLILQNIVVDPHTEWDSPVVITGWLLQNIAWLLFTISMIILGILFYKMGISRYIGLYTILFGLLAFLTFLGDMVIYSFSSDSLFWDMVHAAIYIPFGLVWMLLAIQLYRHQN